MAPDEPPERRRRLLVIGLDGVPPGLLFDQLHDVTPNLSRLVRDGLRAPLRTTDPPLSVPAWPVMFTGVDPGTLGIYGFRHRRAGSYTTMYVPKPTDVPVPTIWEILSDRGYRVGVVGMPLGYPPPHLNGLYVSDFLTPSNARDYTFPSGLRDELEGEFGPYTFDVVFRGGDREALLQELTRMTEQRFAIAAKLYAREPWDVFAVHDVGPDRLNHAYWRCFDRTDPKFVAGNPFENVARTYYAALDRAVGGLLQLADERTLVLVVSDHGSMSMSGCFCINDWLERQGYLVLKRPPPAPGTPLAQLDVDWGRTTAWGEGGYYARIFLNVRGREPHGLIPAAQAPAVRSQLIHELGRIEGPEGGPLGVRVLDPREIYSTVRGDAPDLIVYLGDLHWRSAGTMGHPDLYLTETDVGPEDAVHSLDGVFVLYDPAEPVGRATRTLNIRDVTPTLLDLLGEPAPAHIQGGVMAELRSTLPARGAPEPVPPEELPVPTPQA